MKHIFDTEIAEKYGINAAIIFENIAYWIAWSEANEVNFHDGKYWTYNSRQAFCKQFPYLTKRQIGCAIQKLVDNDIIITGNYNASTYDRTTWYALGENTICANVQKCTIDDTSMYHREYKNVTSMVQKCNIDDTSMYHRKYKNVSPIPNINTNINTYVNTDINNILADVDEGLRDLLSEYIKMRKLIKAPMTPRALDLLIKKIRQFEPDSIERQKRMIENAIEHNWKSVYPLKDDKGVKDYAYDVPKLPEASEDEETARLKRLMEEMNG